jgi:hypothetical protein
VRVVAEVYRPLGHSLTDAQRNDLLADLDYYEKLTTHIQKLATFFKVDASLFLPRPKLSRASSSTGTHAAKK